jgi:geranylgeranyl pyrophosphate synthase
LHEACEPLPRSKKKAILDIIRQAFFEISSAEAKEASLRGRIDISGQEFLDIIRQKVAAGEAATRIGAILGNGTSNEIEILGHYGRTYGVLLTIRDEFVDTFEADELKNRAEKECLPLPLLLTLQDSTKRTRILHLLKGQLTKDKVDKMVDLTIDSKETRDLMGEMRRTVKQEKLKLSPIQYSKLPLELLLGSTLEDL